jgi:hypothetical protein
VVTRQFAIRFRREGAGYRVEDEQVGVEVEAPERMDKFAQMERDRSELNLFPLSLDAQGHIFGEREVTQTAQLEAPVREATEQVARLAVDAAERDDLARFVLVLSQSAAKVVTELPQNLFAPTEPERATTRDVALPTGDAGAVTVRFRATTDPITGLMRSPEREVLTDLSGDRRRTVESWHLAPL